MKQYKDENILFDEIEEDDEEEIVEEDEEKSYSDLDAGKYYFSVGEEDSIFYVRLIPCDFYDEHQTEYNKELTVDFMPDNYSEFQDCYYDEDSGLTKEEIIEELKDIGLVFLQDEDVIETDFLSSTDELVDESEDFDNISGAQ